MCYKGVGHDVLKDSRAHRAPTKGELMLVLRTVLVILISIGAGKAAIGNPAAKLELAALPTPPTETSQFDITEGREGLWLSEEVILPNLGINLAYSWRVMSTDKPNFSDVLKTNMRDNKMYWNAGYVCDATAGIFPPLFHDRMLEPGRYVICFMSDRMVRYSKPFNLMKHPTPPQEELRKRATSGSIEQELSNSEVDVYVRLGLRISMRRLNQLMARLGSLTNSPQEVWEFNTQCREFYATYASAETTWYTYRRTLRLFTKETHVLHEAADHLLYDFERQYKKYSSSRGLQDLNQMSPFRH